MTIPCRGIKVLKRYVKGEYRTWKQNQETFKNQLDFQIYAKYMR